MNWTLFGKLPSFTRDPERTATMDYTEKKQYAQDDADFDKQKDGFEMLEEEWKTEVASLSVDALNNRIAESAKLIVQEQFFLKTDQKIKDARLGVQKLTAKAREEIKSSGKKVESLENVLQDKTEVPSSDQFNSRIAEYAKTVVQNQLFLKNDPEIQAAKQALKELTEDPRENIKTAKKRIEYMNQILTDQGKA